MHEAAQEQIYGTMEISDQRRVIKFVKVIRLRVGG